MYIGHQHSECTFECKDSFPLNMCYLPTKADEVEIDHGAILVELDEPYFLSKGPDPNLNIVDARFSYHLKTPDEPGLYEFVMMIWSDPFNPFTDKDANVLGIHDGGSSNAHSHSLIFEVPSP